MGFLLGLLSLFFFIIFIVGLVKPSVFNKPNKPEISRKQIGWTFGILTLITFFASSAFTSSNSTHSSSSESPTQQVTSKPVAKRNIIITSMIVKKVAPQTYRYFFNIANQDSSDFNGDVWVQLFNGHDTPQSLIFGGGTSSFSNNPVKAGLNSVTYVDDSHAPSQVDGIDGATTFSYSVSIGDNAVASGKGDISSKYEDDLQQ